MSAADRAVEAELRARIAAAFPQDAILGEEGGRTGGATGFTWVIDPIDGTMPFLSGLPHWCVAVALASPAGTEAAATFVPATGELFTAARGRGAFLDGQRLRIPPGLGLGHRMTAIGASHRTARAHVASVVAGLMAAGGIFYRSGSGALMLAEVAAGRLAGYYEPHMHPWDCLGGLLLVAEAGGRVREVDPARMLAAGGPALAAAAEAFDALAAVVAGALPDTGPAPG